MANNPQQKRKYSRPVIKKTLQMRSEASILALDQYIKVTMSSLYALDVILFYIGNEEVAETANKTVRDIFSDKIEMFNKDITKYNSIIEENDFEKAGYTMKQDMDFSIYSPLASVYLNMMGKFELVTNLIDTVWINGELPSKIRKTRVVKLGIHMRNVSQQIQNIAKQAMQIARQQGKVSDVVETMKELEIDSKAIEDVTIELPKPKAITSKKPKAITPKKPKAITPKKAKETTTTKPVVELETTEV